MRVAVLLSLALMTAPVAAQGPGGTGHPAAYHDVRDQRGLASSTNDVLPQADRAAAESAMRRFAQCVVRGDPTMARSVMASAPGSQEESALFHAVAQRRNGCLGQGRLRFRHGMLRGALAEQLYLRSYDRPVQAVAQPDAPLAPVQPGRGAYQAYAACVVKRNSPAADAALRSSPGGSAEKTAYQDIMPSLSSCLSGGDQAKLAIDRVALRGYLAEALYDFRRAAGDRQSGS